MTDIQTRPTGITPSAAPDARPHDTSWVTTFDIDPGLMRLFIVSGLVLVLMTAVGFGWLMHMVPPPSPSDSQAETFRWVKEHQTSILVGAALVTFFWSFWATWAAPIILYIRRMERVPLITFASIANVGGGAAVITTIAVAWTVMAYRVQDPAIVQAFNDLGFFLFLYTWPSFGILMVMFAIAIFRDRSSTPSFPRWVAYYNVYAAVGMVPASFMGLTKTGPLAFNGILAFWLVAVDFFVWMLIMSAVMWKAIAADERRLAQVTSGPPPVA